MSENSIHQLTADEIKGKDPEEVAASLLEKNVQATTFVIPIELHKMFASPRSARIFADWVGKHMNKSTATV